MQVHTRAAHTGAVLQRISELHPDDVPQVLVRPVLAAAPSYTAWVLETTTV